MLGCEIYVKHPQQIRMSKLIRSLNSEVKRRGFHHCLKKSHQRRSSIGWCWSCRDICLGVEAGSAGEAAGVPASKLLSEFINTIFRHTVCQQGEAMSSHLSTHLFSFDFQRNWQWCVCSLISMRWERFCKVICMFWTARVETNVIGNLEHIVFI